MNTLRNFSSAKITILSLALLLSGASALVFQSIWLRTLGLVFGNSVWAATLVLSSFMAGLAIGNAIAAFGRTWRNPLRGFVILELFVGLVGFSVVLSLPSVGNLFRPFFQVIWENPELTHLLRLVLSMIILLIPTTAMGLSFPLVLAEPSLRKYDYRKVVGLFYGLNVLGAVVGILVGEIFLFKALGLLGTAAIAGCCNLAAALLAYACQFGKDPDERSPESFIGGQVFSFKRVHWSLLTVSFASGFVFLSLEIVWFRFLRLYFASSGVVFSVMLAVVLVGISSGSLVSVIIRSRKGNILGLLPFFFMASALVVVFCYAFFPIPKVSGDPPGYYLSEFHKIIPLAAALMFPASFLSGITFPMIVAWCHLSVPSRMNSAGCVTLFNTIGAAAGPFITTFLLLPYAGYEISLFLLALLYLSISFLVGIRSNSFYRKPVVIGAFSVSCVLFLSTIWISWNSDLGHFLNARRPYEVDGAQLIHREEGTADTLQLLRKDLYEQPYYYRLVTNGFSMSGTHPYSQRYMKLFAWLPMILKPDSENALLICYGVGVTADSFLQNNRLKELDIVDISKEVFNISSLYTGLAYEDPLGDSRAKSIVQDGRFFLQANEEKYDIITGEPPPLKVAGTVNLYTKEFFKLMASRLNDGGIATFWLPIYQLKDSEIRSVLAAFQDAFPNCSVWADADDEWIMMGINGQSKVPDVDSIRFWWDDEVSSRDLAMIGLEVPEQFNALFLMGRNDVQEMTRNVERLSDFYPKRLGDAFPDPGSTYAFALNFMNPPLAIERFENSQFYHPGDFKKYSSSLEYFMGLRETRYRLRGEGGNWLAALDYYLMTSQLRIPVLDILNSDEIRVSLSKSEYNNGTNYTPELLRDVVAGAVASRDLSLATSILAKLSASDAISENDLYLLIYLWCLTGATEEAEKLASSLNNKNSEDWFQAWVWEFLRERFGFSIPG
jgi:predicted membrane-bound spermidine synthase